MVQNPAGGTWKCLTYNANVNIIQSLYTNVLKWILRPHNVFLLHRWETWIYILYPHMFSSSLSFIEFFSRLLCLQLFVIEPIPRSHPYPFQLTSPPSLTGPHSHLPAKTSCNISSLLSKQYSWWPPLPRPSMPTHCFKS